MRDHVIEELDFEPSIDAANIGVIAENSVVTLTGHVPSYLQKLAAERAAWRVKGVKALAQKIEVRLPGDKALNDDEIAQRAINILRWSEVVPHDAIRVKVAGGWLTLTGRVEWNYQRLGAEAVVRKLSGVKGVINDIVLVAPAQTQNVRQRIVDALKRHAEIEAARIRVEVLSNGDVKLEGEVDDWNERRAIEQAVWSTPGVKLVHDDIRIV